MCLWPFRITYLLAMMGCWNPFFFCIFPIFKIFTIGVYIPPLLLSPPVLYVHFYHRFFCCCWLLFVNKYAWGVFCNETFIIKVYASSVLLCFYLDRCFAHDNQDKNITYWFSVSNRRLYLPPSCRWQGKTIIDKSKSYLNCHNYSSIRGGCQWQALFFFHEKHEYMTKKVATTLGVNDKGAGRSLTKKKKKNPVPSPNVGKRRLARVCAGNFLAGDS